MKSLEAKFKNKFTEKGAEEYLDELRSRLKEFAETSKDKQEVASANLIESTHGLQWARRELTSREFDDLLSALPEPERLNLGRAYADYVLEGVEMYKESSEPGIDPYSALRRFEYLLSMGLLDMEAEENRDVYEFLHDKVVENINRRLDAAEKDDPELDERFGGVKTLRHTALRVAQRYENWGVLDLDRDAELFERLTRNID